MQQQLLRELQASEGRVELDGVEADGCFAFGKMRTGGLEGPRIWNLLMAQIVVENAGRWRDQGWGISLDMPPSCTLRGMTEAGPEGGSSAAEKRDNRGETGEGAPGPNHADQNK